VTRVIVDDRFNNPTLIEQPTDRSGRPDISPISMSDVD